MTSVVRVGVIGAGNIAKQHIRNLVEGRVPNAKLAATVSRSSEPVDPSVRHFCGWQDFLSTSDIDVDAIIVATPTYTHHEIGLAVLNRGLHLMMEKPLGRSIVEGRSLIDAASEGQVFAVMLNQRTHPAYARIRSILNSNAVGDIQRISWTMTTWYRPDVYFQVSEWRGTWRGEGGGVLINQCIHNIDVLLWLTGMPSCITAFCQFGKYHDIEVDDEVTAFFEYPNGSTGVLVTSTGESPGLNRLDIVGDNGSIHYDGENLIVESCSESIAAHRRETRDMFGAPACVTDTIALDPPVNQHALIVANFAAAILGAESLIAPAREGLASLEFVNAALWSSWTHRTISLPIDAEGYDVALRDRVMTSALRHPSNVTANINMDKSFR